MGASKSFQTRPPRFSPFAVELEGDPNGPFQRLATFLVGNMCSYPFSVMGLENLDRDGMEGIIWDIWWVAVKGQTQIPGLFPLRCFFFYTFRSWACLLFEGLPEPFRAGDLVRPPVQSLEFHVELSWEDRFQFFHVLLAKGDPFVLRCAIEQSRQRRSCL